jgi:1,2-phenylacetyl-CoA epoxidase PaaB subunit
MTYKVNFSQEFLVEASDKKEAIQKAREIFKRDINIGHYRSQQFEPVAYILR